eukprot:9820176-Lingulodinium_polyedra.AAC.1
MGVALDPAGGAPGTEGLPYEVYQVAEANPACLVGHAVVYDPFGSWAVLRVIGAEPDLLVWMPLKG